MKNTLKCEFELLVLVKNWENETMYVKKFKYKKKSILGPFSVSNPFQSVSECPKFLKIRQITNFDMGFQKINMRSRFFLGDFSDRCT